MRKYAIFVVAFLALIATGSFALAEAPWERGQPKDMTALNAKMAQDAQQFIQKNGRAAFGVQPNDVVWDKKNLSEPVSNISAKELRNLMVGRYNIVMKGPETLEVRYLDDSNVFHGCYLNGHTPVEFKILAGFKTGVSGPGGIMLNAEFDKSYFKAHYGYPAVSSPKDGALDLWQWGRSKWVRTRTWVQEEIPAYAAERCKELPRTGKINALQNKRNAVEWSRAANKVTSAAVIFEHSSLKPLTAEMLYWAYPPK
ncbi:hypothetical protein HJ526_19130 [Donghicola sp. C2-DW-16]|uniref:Uncharacterized protein n=1 Tax=Donghicola mangrovi TaxID=2729614 RepID=A0ABX2PJD7_9RHOB|nr:hypothetical protein [Donghicola mangrovi]NVO29538.1 hypothetical protein [Donghicola mangrovi]